MSDPRWPDDGPDWPEHDLEHEGDTRTPEMGHPAWVDERPFEPGPEPTPEPDPGPEIEPRADEVPWAPERVESDDAQAQGVAPPPVESAAATTAFSGDRGWDPRVSGERRRPTTAEQAVPWMIGIILALAGMVIVLVALIFTFPGGLAGGASPTPTPIASLPPSQAPGPSMTGDSLEPTPSSAPTATPPATPTPTPVPAYGALEMVYLGRPSALAPIYLLRRDFSKDADATVMAQAEQGITAFDWSPDGRLGAAIIAGRAVALTPGQSARALADDVTAITFGWDAETVYAARVVRDGANDQATVLEIDFVSGGTKELATITYPHPVTAPDAALREAQFIDDGGLVRLRPMADGNLSMWVLGAPATYRVDAADGRVQEVDAEPTLWAPDGRQRIVVSDSNGTSTLTLENTLDEAKAAVQVTGLVSHVRWAASDNEIVFTLGRLGTSGGVRQDLYVWDLADGKAPMALTSNGVSFGAEWLGTTPNWMP
jgi:hypothetical protein